MLSGLIEGATVMPPPTPFRQAMESLSISEIAFGTRGEPQTKNAVGPGPYAPHVHRFPGQYPSIAYRPEDGQHIVCIQTDLAHI